MREFEEEEGKEADDNRNLVVGSINIILNENEVADEEANPDNESLSGPNVNDFEETIGTSGLMVNRYDPMLTRKCLV